MQANKQKWEQMTFSELQRYVIICEVVFNSDAFLSQQDRSELIQELTSTHNKLNPVLIELECKRMQDKQLEYNMINAQNRRSVLY